ncbi:MAG: N-acetylneuraminate synthase family protein [Thaumarchaeota archaeon]|nr:N-acetylneuraminate synthase family protein [Nitrososphaerota archaeon]
MHFVDFLGKKIGDGYPSYVISEIGVNFRTLEEGKKLIDASIAAGADSVKIQTFKAENLASKEAIFDLPSTGKQSQYDVFQDLEIPEEIQRGLFSYAHAKNIVFFSTPSDKHDVNFLESLEMKIYKIGSDDANNIPFLEYVAQLKKPTIVSTGMCTMEEAEQIKDIFSSYDNDKLALLHCVTKYPTEPKYVNLNAINSMKQKLQIPVGYSDHSIGIEVCKAAVAFGANVIEKHVTLDKNQKGPDHILSATPTELSELVAFSRLFYSALGDGVKRPAECEEFTRKESRKSVVALQNIPIGTVLKEDLLGTKRPGHGIPSSRFKELIGKITKTEIKKNQMIKWSDLI